MTFRKIELKEISDILEVELVGTSVEINSLNLANRDLFGNNLTYIGNESYLEYLAQKEIVAAFISKEHLDLLDAEIIESKSFIVVDKPEQEFYKLHEYLCEQTDFYFKHVNVKYGENVKIHPTAVIEDGVQISDNVIIGANVVIHSGSIIGNNVVIEPGSVIGTQGFQVLYNNEVPYLVKHVGGVKISDNVSIGANTCISNSLFDGYTEIGESTKIDSLVFIAHNCKIGSNCVITSGVVMAGSSTLDSGVWLAPNSVILNRVNVGMESFVGSHTLVMKSVPDNTKVIGVPARRVGNTESRYTPS
ncbi:hypothetical protein DZ860_08185 [Vibrio sinensis]|uniref:UDP-3-O-(3-hydroxymyristoyl)glucosamine N-acyltransferase n=1 Tax=Vibrio sinensis TaxID=2302434 RepID=A0A3A6QHP6_9VIBR|nr:hypothetical protein [Vibrio sinensis]RJX72380.1 hypothetical protein DZ860_08185 [Vibrio sinensis]